MVSTSSAADPASSYDRTWASNLVKRAWQRLYDSFATDGKQKWIEAMRPFIAGGSGTPPSHDDIAAELGVPVATFRTSLMRSRQRYREILREEVAHTVSDPADVDEELQYLYRILMS